MPHQSLKLIPGVDQTKTPALNEAAISESQLVRFVPDRTLGGIVQKIGGWSRYVSTQFNSIIRALHPWSDTNTEAYLAVGAEGSAPLTITNISGSGTVVTVTFSGTANLTVGYAIQISGVNPVAYNGTFNITGINGNTLTYASTATGAYVSGGLIYGGGGALSVVHAGDVIDITPQSWTSNPTVSFSTTLGSPIVNITDPTLTVSPTDVVDIRTQVAVGGLVLYGQYAIYNAYVGANTYSIIATDIFGDPVNATSTVASGGAVPQYTSYLNSDVIRVTLANHGYLEGTTFPARVATMVGGVPVYGSYIVNEVISASQFDISIDLKAYSAETVYENSGNANFVYARSIGPAYGNQGYGLGLYGEGDYGFGIVPPSQGGVPINAEDWCLDNWGETLLASPYGGTIYTWNPNSGERTALAIGNAPSANYGFFVAMPQRQIVAWGSTQTGLPDPMLIRWCDVNNYDTWAPTIENQAGSYRIPKGSHIVQCIQGPQQGIVWTNLGVWAMQYTGPPYVYQFNEIGTGCGLIGHKAAGSMNGVVYWMGQNQFFRMAGGGVEPLKCPVWDVVFQDLDRDHVDKIRIAPNSQFGEVAWHFPITTPGANTGENWGYIKYNVLLDQWDYGFNSASNPYVSRSAWSNESVVGRPVGADLNRYLQQHEVSTDADGSPLVSYFQTGYFVLTEADVKMFIDQVWPDMKWGYYGGDQDAQIRLYFYVTDYAGTAPTVYGPYTLTQATTYITPRFRGRLVSIRIESTDLGSFWRIGNFRYRLQPDGRF